MINKNILVILCDQLSAMALESYGNTYNNAPNIKAIADSGAVIERAYTSCPLCQPARASLWTSKFPHQTKVLSNLPDQGFPTLSEDILTIGEIFTNNGYDCHHFGKMHDYGSLRGFKCHEQVEIAIERENQAITYNYETFLDENTTRQVEEYFGDLNNESPFFAIADLQNPHNICSYVGENEFSHKSLGEDIILPELPNNYDIEDMINRPEFIAYLCCAHRRQSQVTSWNEDDFQHYLYAYHHYIHLVDKQVGRIIKALEESGNKEETMIVFLADHGEGMAGHKMVTKYGTFYEETNRVPLFFSSLGIQNSKRINGVVSLIDVFPTLLDYAGIPGPDTLEGRSLYKYLISESTQSNNNYAVGEWYDEFSGYQVPGRMYVDNDYKYTRYKDIKYNEQGNGENIIAEELYNMKEDPQELTNLVNKKNLHHILDSYREKLHRHILKTEDDFESLSCIYSNRYRQHTLGFKNHKGPVAVLEYAKTKKS